MSKISYSKVNTFEQCPYKYKLRYIDKFETKFDEKPDNALVLGTACHEGIEKRSIDSAIESYKSNYSIWNDNNEIEILKLKEILPRAISGIPEGEYEYKLDDEDFVGYIDMLVKIEDGLYDLYDFKYSNNASRYKKSGQIHVYKYYYEKLTGNKIRDMYYVIIPKSKIVLAEGLTPDTIKNEISKDLENKKIKFEKIEYNQPLVDLFFEKVSLLENTKTYEKKYNTFCSYCEYKRYCVTNGLDKSELKEPSNEEVNRLQF